MRISSGTYLGPYEICSPLGVGGMGEVYKARDSRLGRFVAVKVLLACNHADVEMKRRFAQEARTASALNHPGIVGVYDVGSQDGLDYIAMEFVEGKTLEALVPRDGLSLRDVLRYATQTADALAAAHSANVLHRDLKPGNLIITPNGTVKVLDFGLAKLIDAPAGDQRITGSIVSTTQAGTVIGTAAYMSPEQAEGKVLDCRSDIFSFGAVLYEMTTGRKPFQGDTPLSTILSILRDEPQAIQEIRPDAPAELDRLIRRCLKKDPARRIQSMSDLRASLEDLKDEFDSGTLSKASLPPVARTGLWLLGAGVVACLLVIAVMLHFLDRSPDQNARPVPLTSYQGDERQPDFSPDGRQVAFTWNGDKQDNWDIYLKVVDSSAAPLRLTTSPASDTRPKWSPDGRSIAFVRSTADSDAVMLTSALGGAERLLASFPTAIDAGISWSPDSRWLAVTAGAKKGPTSLRLVSVETGDSRVLTTPPAPSGGDFEPAFSPDGRSLAFVREHGMNVEALWVLPLNRSYQPQGEPKKILSDGKHNHDPVWTADGRELIFSSGDSALAGMYRMPADGSLPPRRIDALGDGVTEPALSGSSHRLAYTRTFRSASIWRLDKKQKVATAEQFIASSSYRDVFPQYSPDGRKIVFYSNRTGLDQIWTCNADGTQPVQQTFMTGTTTGTPRWSPDGRRIAFDSNTGGYWQVYVVSAAGGKPMAVTSGDWTNVVASWSRDGKWIYFSSNRTGTQEVWKIPAPSASDTVVSEGTRPAVQVTQHGGTSSLESPDGQTLYFTKTTPRFDYSLWKMPVNGGQETEVIPSLHRYNFVVTAKTIFFDTPSGPDSPSEVEGLDIATGRVTNLYKVARRIDVGLALSPDERYLLFAQLDYLGSDLMSVDNFR